MTPFSSLQRYFLAASLLALSVSCSPAARTNIGAAMGRASNGATAPTKLMIFGGEGHRTYLGCLNCSTYAIDSVFNAYGDHGSRYSSASVWNHYGDFGSRYSDYGACNLYANDPPVIVDSEGNFYGRLTLNVYHIQIGAGARYHDWLLSTICEQ